MRKAVGAMLVLDREHLAGCAMKRHAAAGDRLVAVQELDGFLRLDAGDDRADCGGGRCLAGFHLCA